MIYQIIIIIYKCYVVGNGKYILNDILELFVVMFIYFQIKFNTCL